MLAILQLGLCGRCGRARYATRRTARHAARVAVPGIRLRAYRCRDAWHLTSPAGRPQFITPPVTMLSARPQTRLDRKRRDMQLGFDRRHSKRCNGGRTPSLVLEPEGVAPYLGWPCIGPGATKFRWIVDQ
ncbi:hypothetical protein OHR68_35440 [Spirillospora sp. NBC_00431]